MAVKTTTVHCVEEKLTAASYSAIVQVTKCKLSNIRYEELAYVAKNRRASVSLYINARGKYRRKH
jgi:3'-phosphoadenosine 5'-phosphosulfate sulfotransferase